MIKLNSHRAMNDSFISAKLLQFLDITLSIPFHFARFFAK